MSAVDQRIFGCPIRQDGHDRNGTPGDCLRAAVASLLDLPYNEVPHFALHLNWWDALRRWARGQDFDFCGAAVENVARNLEGWYVPDGMRMLASGPSPRGPFWHTVVAEKRGEQITVAHDPHPSRAGLVEVRSVKVIVAPYLPAPMQLALPARCAA